MDDPYITMEEYIKLEEEKAQKRGKVFNWETAKYGKIWYDEDVLDLRSVETKFPAIVFNDNLTSNETLSCEPMVSSLNNNEIDFRISFDESDDEDYTVVGYTKEIVHDFEQMLETIFDKKVNRVHILDFEGLTPDMRQDLAERMRMVYSIDDGQEVFVSHAWRRLFGIWAPLVQEFILEFFSTCRIGDAMGLDVAGGLGDYWVEISSGRDFLEAHEKVTATGVFYLCSMHQGAANVPYLLAQYFFSHAEGRKSGVRLSGGHFIGCLAHHFGLVSDDGLRGLSVVTHELPLIDIGELVKLNIYREIGDDWAWVAPGPERQQVAAAGAPKAAKDAPAVDEGDQADSAHMWEEMQGLRQDVRSLHGLVERSMTDQNVNPSPTNNPPVLPTALHAQVVQELNELLEISTYIDSRLENINQFLNGFTQKSNEIDVDDLEPDNESVDTPLVSPLSLAKRLINKDV
nr:hypothetical protein [Tanacetum cinerariifolium]